MAIDQTLKTGNDVSLLTLDGSRPTDPLLDTTFREFNPEISAD